MTKKEVVSAYKGIAKRLNKLHVGGSPHISRTDNNWVFEAARRIEAIATSIDEEYQEHCPACDAKKRDAGE